VVAVGAQWAGEAPRSPIRCSLLSYGVNTARHIDSHGAV